MPPTIFVNAFLLKPANEVGVSADYRVGVVRLDIDISQKALNIEVEAASEAASPQETISYKIRVTDYKGDPVVAEVGICRYRSGGSVSVTPRQRADFGKILWPGKGLSVRTSSSLVKVAQRCAPASCISPCVVLEEAEDFLGLKYHSTCAASLSARPYWNPAIVTDSKGEATIEVRLPDNLTTWRLDARAWTAAHDGNLLLGETTLDLLSTRPLLIRPVTPRFFIAGERSRCWPP